MKKDKIRVGVLYGGRSGEHEVSLVTATNIIQYLDRSRFEVIPIGIDKEGAWFLGDDVFKKELDSPQQKKMLRLQCDSERLLFDPELIGKNNLPVPPQTFISTSSDRIFDVVFPAIHGPLCEDGTVQGLLELADVAYVGCGVLASAVGMDKDVSKRLVQAAGIRVPEFIVIRQALWEKDSSHFCNQILEQLTLPVFVKPVNTGSSVGIRKVKKIEDLVEAINDAFQYDVKVIVEKNIDAREIEVAVLETPESCEPFASIPGEIKPTAAHEFYSYASKYLDAEGADLAIPAPLDAALQDEVQKIAKTIFNTLNCEGMARVDLFLEKSTNQIFFNEINSIPGFTQISMYPKLMAASGVGYTELLTKLIEIALLRHDQKKKIRREYIAN